MPEKFYPLVAELENGQLRIVAEDGEELRRLGPADSTEQVEALLRVYGYVPDREAVWQDDGPAKNVHWYGFLTYERKD